MPVDTDVVTVMARGYVMCFASARTERWENRRRQERNEANGLSTPRPQNRGSRRARTNKGLKKRGCARKLFQDDRRFVHIS